MNRAHLDKLAHAVLYEGYVLYPYRASSLKNSRRLTFGVLYPETWPGAQGGADRSFFHMECLLRGDGDTSFSAVLRFLQLVSPGGEGMEREVEWPFTLADALAAPLHHEFSFGSQKEGIQGEMTAAVTPIAGGLHKLTIVVRNAALPDAPDAELAMACALVSAHAAVTISRGEFLSLTDPPPDAQEAARECRNVGVWPILAGTSGATDTILASPIILPDYPEVAPESAGDLCDSTEIDEILTLRILTLTDEEKAEVRNSESRAREILERAEAIPAEHMMRLHGTIRGLAPAKPDAWSAWDSPTPSPIGAVDVAGVRLRPGDRVRLCPGKRGDIFDSALAGRVAVIEGVEQDFEDRVHVAVVLEDDPGRDLGEQRQIGHRFFFSPDEMTPLEAEAR
ncbi:MAG TPA: hypothetical protein VHW09_28350 [Bryobacteraceae bacterium]|jgi:hypothetical protein|nr:hypothetical protein [Bryobacteraceae bacterium]